MIPSNIVDPRRREAQLVDGFTKEDLGLEVAPYFNPMAPKRDGWNVRTLDVFDTKTLRAKAAVDPLIPKERLEEIEEVDFVGSATELAALVPADLHGTFDYIVSSHDFEHLPNPIKFLEGAETLLRQGGRVVMAVPDARGSFDVFRPHTVFSEWIEAYLEDRPKPTRRQVFDQRVLTARLSVSPEEDTVYSSRQPRGEALATGDVLEEFKEWQQSDASHDYIDAHCTIMTPASLALLFFEARLAGLLRLDVERIAPLPGRMEFIVRLEKTSGATKLPDAEDAKKERLRLMQAIYDERGADAAPPERHGATFHPNQYDNRILRKVFGNQAVSAINSWNVKRLQRRRSRAGRS